MRTLAVLALAFTTCQGGAKPRPCEPTIPKPGCTLEAELPSSPAPARGGQR